MRPLILRASALLMFLFTIAFAPGGNAQDRSVPANAAPPASYAPSNSNAGMVPGTPLPKELSSRETQSDDSFEAARRKEIQKTLNHERNIEIQKETDQILQLATDLKKSVDASVAGDLLSVQAIKKTDEIEKLAKKVRGKMKETYNEPPGMDKLPDASKARAK